MNHISFGIPVWESSGLDAGLRFVFGKLRLKCPNSESNERIHAMTQLGPMTRVICPMKIKNVQPHSVAR